MVTVNAIFAGFSGALVAVLITIADRPFWIQVSIGLGLASLILFALAAERITDALDEGKVNKYMYSMLIYNIAVVLLFLSLAVFLFARCYYLPGVIPILGTFYPWVNDIYWFLFAQEKEKQAYIEEICKED
jgi:hypothetical protein